MNTKAPLDFIDSHPAIKSIVEAAYRFCRHEPGATVVLTGTSHQSHLSENIAAVQADILPRETSAKLESLFGNINSVSGN